MEDAAAGVVPTEIGKGGTPVVPLVAVAVDEPMVEAEVAVAAAGGVDVMDAAPETAALTSSYLVITRTQPDLTFFWIPWQ